VSGGIFVSSPHYRIGLGAASVVGTDVPGFLMSNSNCTATKVPPSGWFLSSVFHHFLLNSSAALPLGSQIRSAVQVANAVGGPWTDIDVVLFSNPVPAGGVWSVVRRRLVPGQFVRAVAAPLNVALVSTGNSTWVLCLKD
jgi:hypothetical protein